MLLELSLIFVLSLLLIKLLKQMAPNLGLIDIPNERSSHTTHTPRGAGIGFFFAVLLIVPFFHLELLLSHIWSITAIGLIFIVGVLDDHKDTSPNTKFIVIIIATILLSFDNIIIDDLGTFFGFPLSLGFMALPFTIFAVVGFTNALNLIDGLDGLAGTISIIILATFFFVGYQHHDFFIMIISASFVASLLAFLIFNWQPASIFMGDSGSLTLGFIISLLAVKSLAYIPTISILFIAAIPIFDTVIVLIRRKCKGKSMFLGDRCHMHHILRHFFAEHSEKTVLFLGLMQSSYSILGLQLDKSTDEGPLLLLFIVNTAILYLALNAMIRRQKRDC